MIGPGLPGSPDFVERIDSVGGAPAKGLFLPNYGNAPGERNDTRMLRRRAGPTKAACDYILRGIAAELRDTVGMNVRQPSSNVPPFRAQQWSFSNKISFPTAGAVTSLAFSAAGAFTEVPDGVLGVLSHMNIVTFPSDDAGIGDAPLTLRVSFRKNAVTVPGYENMIPGFTREVTITDAAGSDSNSGTFLGPKVCVPIKLEQGDTISIFTQNSGVEPPIWQGVIGLCGWFYPIEVDADGILGTVADRGSGITAGGRIAPRD